MDFKLLIIFLGLLLLILYLAKTMIDMKGTISKVEANVDVNFKHVKSRLNLLSTEIKNYNADLIASAKKMNKINSQQITSMSNYYTESESDGNKNLIEYLSDVKNKSDFKINFNTQEEKEEIINKTIHEHGQEEKQESEKEATQSEKEEKQQSEKEEIQALDPLNIISDDESNESLVKSQKSSKSQKSNNSQKSSQSQKSNNSQKSSKSSIKLENITIGSTATGKGKKLNISNQTDLDSNEDKEITTIDDLKNISSYNKFDLELIAKTFSLPLTYIDLSQNRKIYKKEELYNSIKDYLVKNKN